MRLSRDNEDIIRDIVTMRDGGVPIADVMVKIEAKYGVSLSYPAISRAYRKYADAVRTTGDINVWLKNAKDATRATEAKKVASKEARLALTAAVEADDLLTLFKDVIGSGTFAKTPKPPSPPKKKDRTDVTMEVLLSDLHFGKLTKTYDLAVAKRRLKQFVSVVEQEYRRKLAHYNVESMIIGMLGDIIENETMHGIESSRGAEFGNAEQAVAAIDLLLNEVLIPLYQLGVPIKVMAITGNHDRTEDKKTYQTPGKFSYTWIIYHALQMFTAKLGMTSVEWIIPEGVYAALNIYGDTILYEHSDHVAGRVFDKKALLAHMAKRGSQLNTVIKGMRVGHYHEATCVDNGRVIGNGSLCGQDSFSDILGFQSVPSQTISYYVKTANRSTSFYYSFPVYLGD